jgi:hypothetical protein
MLLSQHADRRSDPKCRSTQSNSTRLFAGVVGGLVQPPDLETLLADVAESLGSWTYALVAGLAFLETGAFVGLVAPGETAIALGGSGGRAGVRSASG